MSKKREATAKDYAVAGGLFPAKWIITDKVLGVKKTTLNPITYAKQLKKLPQRFKKAPGKVGAGLAAAGALTWAGHGAGKRISADIKNHFKKEANFRAKLKGHFPGEALDDVLKKIKKPGFLIDTDTKNFPGVVKITDPKETEHIGMAIPKRIATPAKRLGFKQVGTTSQEFGQEYIDKEVLADKKLFKALKDRGLI